MVRLTGAVFLLSLMAIALNLTGLWKDANGLALGLSALTLILVLLLIINGSDRGTP